MHGAKKKKREINKFIHNKRLRYFYHMCKVKTKKEEEEEIATTLKPTSLISLLEINYVP